MMLAVLLTILAAVASPPAGAATLPDVLYTTDRTNPSPVWVAASAAFDESGHLRPALFPQMVASMERQYGRPGGAQHVQPESTAGVREIRTADCRDVIGGVIAEGVPAKPEQTIVDLATGSIAIYRARALSVTPGFYAKLPGSLVHAEIVEALRATPQIDVSHGLNVFHLYARFAAGGLSFCSGYAPIEPGDEFMVYVYRAPVDEQHTIVDAETRIFIEHGGKLTGPAGNAVLRKTAPRNLDELHKNTVLALRRASAR
jgi:hypothetical protein